MAAGCLMCGTSENLTRHHLLPEGTYRRKRVPRLSVVLCESCHRPLHVGGEQVAQWKRLWPLLTDAQRRHVIAHREPESIFGDRITKVQS